MYFSKNGVTIDDIIEYFERNGERVHIYKKYIYFDENNERNGVMRFALGHECNISTFHSFPPEEIDGKNSMLLIFHPDYRIAVNDMARELGGYYISGVHGSDWIKYESSKRQQVRIIGKEERRRRFFDLVGVSS